MNDKPMSYAEAGVNIDNGNASVELMKPHVKRTIRPEVVTGLGGFGGLFALKAKDYEEPILVSGTDGVGTKLQLAFQTGIHDTIGIDAVAMCVNDILVSGAEPLFFLDYLAVGKLAPERVEQIVKGVAEGCVQSNCALIGGETAEMPGFYREDEYDVAGFSVGVVDKKDMIDGSNVKAGDKIIGLASTGLHSNGFSLARKVFFDRAGYTVDTFVEELGGTIGSVLLTPTKIYVPYVLPLIKSLGKDLKAMAHITGGGLLENVPRVLPEKVSAKVDKNAWDVPRVFTLMQSIGNIEEKEMFRTFNMGIGFVMVVSEAVVDDVMASLKKQNMAAYLIGEIVDGDGEVVFA